MKPDSFVENPLNRDFCLSPLSAEYHQEDSFREQMGVLYLAGVSETHVTLMRSFLVIGEPGAVSLDDKNPGQDTPEAWEAIDSYIEKAGVVGTFHTHPPLIMEFSEQDERAQNGLAKVNGFKLLWHGVRACDSKGIQVQRSGFVCCQMLGDRIFRYHYGHVDDSLDNPIIVLPLPPKISCKGNFLNVTTTYNLSIPTCPNISSFG